MACVKRRRNRWVVDFTDAAGKRRWESYRTRDEADAALSKRVRQLDNGSYLPEAAVPTFRAVAGDWLEGKRSRAMNTYVGYQTHLELHLLPALGDLTVRELRASHFETFRAARLRAGLSPQTVNKLLTTAAAVLKLAERRDLIDRNPARVVERCRRQVREIAIDDETRDGDDGAVDPATVLSPEQVGKLLQHAPAGLYRAYLWTAALTGARPGELTGLTWADIDLERRMIRIRRTVSWARERGAKGPARAGFYPPKTKAGRRDIPIPAELVLQLRGWKAACPATDLGLVFPGDNGKPKHRSTITHKGMKPALTAAKLPHVKLYSLRHSYASILILKREPDTSIAKKMGHADANMTRRVYAHWFEGVETGAVDEIGAMIGAAATTATASM